MRLNAAPREAPLVPLDERRPYRSFAERVWRDVPLRRGLRPWLGARELKRLAVDNGFDERALPRDLDARQWAAVYTRSTLPAWTRGRGARSSGTG